MTPKTQQWTTAGLPGLMKRRSRRIPERSLNGTSEPELFQSEKRKTDPELYLNKRIILIILWFSCKILAGHLKNK